MENEYEALNYVIDKRKPVEACLDLDNFYREGIKFYKITINGKEFTFTKDQIFKFLEFIEGRIK